MAGAVPLSPAPPGSEPTFEMFRPGDPLEADPPTRFWIETDF